MKKPKVLQITSKTVAFIEAEDARIIIRALGVDGQYHTLTTLRRKEAEEVFGRLG